MSQKSVNLKLLTIFGVVAVILISFLGISYLNTTSYIQTSNQLIHKYQFSDAYQDTFSALQELEYAEIGYIFTENKKYLDDYHTEVAKFNEAFSRLTQLNSQAQDVSSPVISPNQSTYLKQLLPLLSQKQADFNKVINLRQNQGLEAAVAARQSSNDEALLEQIHQLIDQMDDYENNQINQVIEKVGVRSNMTLGVVGILSLLTIVLFLAIYIIIRRYFANHFKMEQALQTERDFALQVMNTMEQPLVVMDNSAKFEYVNPAFALLCGYSQEELTGKQPLEVIPQENNEMIAEIMARPTQLNKYAYEANFTNRNGESAYIEVDGIPFSREGNSAGRIVVITNLTKRKQLEDEMLKALESERELSSLKTRFVSMVSHEFRNPLSTLLTLTELLDKYSHKFDEAKKKEYFGIMKIAIDNMTGLLEDVLFIGKGQAGRLEFKPIELNLTSWCRDLITELQLTTDKNHTFSFSKPEADLYWSLDQRLMRQVMVNLLSNALKYSPEGGTVELNLACEDNTETLVIQVRDHGIGIPLEDQVHLFDTFHRSTNVGNIPGTGLGLAIVHQSVEIQQGHIEVVSVEGEGTTFTLKFPKSPQSDLSTPKADYQLLLSH